MARGAAARKTAGDHQSGEADTRFRIPNSGYASVQMRHMLSASSQGVLRCAADGAANRLRAKYDGGMCSIPGRSGTALLVIDVQNGVVSSAYEREERVANMARLVADARAHHVPVIWVQHSDPGLVMGTDDWQIVPELVPADGEHIVHKRFRSSFVETDLESVLDARAIGHLVVCGAQTEFCIRNTVHSAYDRGYDVTLVEDAHTTEDGGWDDRPLSARDIIDEQNRAAWQYELPGRTCTLVSTENAFAAVSL